MYNIINLEDIRHEFCIKYLNKEFVTDKSGVKTLEIIGSTFKVTDPFIFRRPNMDYVEREIQWYNSCSLNVNDIPGKTPKIWEQVADKRGFINSNYGWCIFSEENGNQYKNTLEELQSNSNSRRALMIYNRPSMHTDYNTYGMSDFMCTNAVQYLVRDNKLNAVVQMRSNDAVFGFLNDYQWQLYVLKKLSNDLEVKTGDIYWNVGSLHVYERHFYLVHHYTYSGETDITKAEFDKLYGPGRI